MSPHATITEESGIITVTINRPEKLNAISPAVTEAFWEAARLLSERSDLRCMVITGVGKYFTAGLDLTDPGPQPTDPDDEHAGWTFRRRYRQHHLLYDEFEAIEKPIIIAAQGVCIGSGVEMAASCDFRFCTPNATFRLPEVQMGAIAGSGGTSRLTRLIGPAWGKWMSMAAMTVGAEQAKTIGLVHDIFPVESFLDDVYAFCRRLAGFPPEALGLAKLAVDMATDVQDRTVQRHVDRLAVTTTIAQFERSMQRFADGDRTS